MGVKIKALGASVVGDNGRVRHFRQGEPVDDVSAEVLAQLRAMPDTLTDGDGSALGLDATTPENQARIVAELAAKGITAESGGTATAPSGPAPTIDVALASVEDVAKFIDAHNLNAPETVKLAGGDPALASKVIEAEKLSTGGDGRSTAIKPLEKLAAG